MRTIWKFDVEPVAFTLSMPKGADVLSVQMQGLAPKLWAMVDPRAKNVNRSFRVIGTGREFDENESLSYIGTFQQGGGVLVWHLFEII